MARAIWKGHLTFGLVMIPVSLVPGEVSQAKPDLTMLDERDRARIRYRRVNERTGEEVPWKSIVKGYEYAEGEYVIVDTEDLKAAAPKAVRAIEITDFVPRGAISPRFFERPYLIEPAPSGEKAYVLLREALKRTERAGIATVVIQTRQHLAAVIAEGDAIVVDTMRFADELRDPADLKLPRSGVKATPRELHMAEKLVEGMSTDWNPERYHDEYAEAVRAWIEEKAGGAPRRPRPPARERVEGPYNLLELLRKSVEGHKPATRAKGTAARARRARIAGAPKPAERRRKTG